MCARRVNLGYLRLQFRTPARESAHVVSPEHPQQSILSTAMSDKMPGDDGKYLKLSSADTVVGTTKGEIFMYISHSVLCICHPFHPCVIL